jgi:ABC-type transporter Mla subunit MlaD
MIGYYKDIQWSNLVYCLRTALYSTLVALVWVFLVAFPVRSLMQYWQCQVNGKGRTPEPDILDGLKDVAFAFVKAAEDVKTAVKQVVEFSAEIVKIHAEIGKLKDAMKSLKEGLETSTTEVAKVLKKLSEESDARLEITRTEAETRLEVLMELKSDLERSRKAAQAAEQRAALAESKLALANANVLKLRGIISNANNTLSTGN